MLVLKDQRNRQLSQNQLRKKEIRNKKKQNKIKNVEKQNYETILHNFGKKEDMDNFVEKYGTSTFQKK